MTILHVVEGPVLVTWGLSQLGYSRDGVQIRVEPKWIDIPCDEWGGASGAPADAQLVGAVGHVQCDLTKYDQALCQALTSFVLAGTVGVLPVFGTLMRQGTKTAALTLTGTANTLGFSTTFVRQAIEVNRGTRFSTFVCAFECWLNAADTRTLFTDTPN